METLEKQVLEALDVLRQKKGSLSLLTEILELHLKYNVTRDFHLNQLHSHLRDVFKIDTNPLLNYLADDNSFLHSDDKFIKEINILKMKYGYFLKNNIQKMKNPFMLNFAETNIEPGGAEHKLSFQRADGKRLDVMFTPGTLLPIISLLSTAAIKSINEGVYQLNEEIIDFYLNESDKLISILTAIKLGHIEED
ncbi:hypothetical protein [Neobacillus sp. YIM B06451]|uniref:hypothetical protein n=1 Tax=Neobacillus sp. YIM B06451 TaxID=3070994 RepID=UPI00292F5D7F|nr:hypothetical protein [Neobacillus sp. YIM B06451]